MTLSESLIFLTGRPLLLIALLVWVLFWKGLALWQAARASQRNWFIILLVVNTLGLLEIIYLFFVAGWPRRKEAVRETTKEEVGN